MNRWVLEEVPRKLMEEVDIVEKILNDGGYEEFARGRVLELKFNMIWIKYR